MEVCCRLCLNRNRDELNPIFLQLEDDLQKKIKDCVNIEITEYDGLPTSVCGNCVSKIQEWYTFKRNCTASNCILIEKLNQTSAIELDGIEETNGNAYNCTICPSEFDSVFEYLDHQIEHNGESVFKCDHCTDIFDNRNDLVKHENNHLEVCTECGVRILKASMKLHLNQHTDRHMCNQCNKCFNSNATLSQHVIAVHTDRKDHICDTCGKRFSTKTALIVHLRSHSDQRLYKCNLCNYAGRTASALYIHKSIHSNQIRICEICSKIYKSLRNLNDHQRRVHCKEKKHQCTYCNKRFVDKYMLTVHIRSHTGIKPYHCELCDKTFVRSDSLKEHRLIHQKQQFECVECRKKFKSKRGLTRHCCCNKVNDKNC